MSEIPIFLILPLYLDISDVGKPKVIRERTKAKNC